ncbi:Ig-like domain-containing protein, partial [Ignatzschineria cameli]
MSSSTFLVVNKKSSNEMTVNGSKIVLHDASIVHTGLYRADVAEFIQEGNNLVLKLKNGQVIVIENFFVLHDDLHSDVLFEDDNGIPWLPLLAGGVAAGGLVAALSSSSDSDGAVSKKDEASNGDSPLTDGGKPGKEANDGGSTGGDKPGAGDGGSTGGDKPGAGDGGSTGDDKPGVGDGGSTGGDKPGAGDGGSTGGDKPGAGDGGSTGDDKPGVGDGGSTGGDKPGVGDGGSTGGDKPGAGDGGSTGDDKPGVGDGGSTGGDKPGAGDGGSTGGDKPGAGDGGSTGGDKPGVGDGGSTGGDKPGAGDGGSTGDDKPGVGDGGSTGGDKPGAGDGGSTGGDKPGAGDGGSTGDDKPGVGDGGSTADDKPGVGDGGSTGGDKPGAGDGGSTGGDKPGAGDGGSTGGDKPGAGDGGSTGDDKPGVGDGGSTGGDKPGAGDGGSTGGDKPGAGDGGSTGDDKPGVGDGGSTGDDKPGVEDEIINTDPEADPEQGFTIEEDTVKEGQIIATDVDGDDLTYTVAEQPKNGTLELTPETGEYTYKPHPDFNGDDSFKVIVSDGQGGEVTVEVPIIITPVNDAPEIEDATVTFDENIASGTKIYDVNDNLTGSDLDLDGDQITYTITAGNEEGIFEIDPNTGVITIAEGKTLDYETLPTHQLTVTATDGTFTDTAEITVKVNNLNDNAPEIEDATVTFDENIASGTKIYDVNDNLTGSDLDLDGDQITYTITAGNEEG